MESEATIPLQLQPYLGSGERLLWSGRPKQGVMFRPADIVLVPLSLVWGGFAIFWEAMALSSVMKFQGNEPLFPAFTLFPLFGIPFVLFGLYLIVGRFFVDAKQREKTVYGVTTERVIIVSGILRPTVKSLNLKTLSDLSLSERGDGSGTIVFGSSAAIPPWLLRSRWPGTQGVGPPCFEAIPRARSVHDLIRDEQGAGN